MLNINKLIIESLRVCSYCGLFFPKQEYFCESCWDVILSMRLKSAEQSVQGYPFKVRSLFLWRGPKSDYIKTLVYSLKNNGSPSMFEKLSLLFEFPQILPEILIPAPAREIGNTTDHAWLWNQSLSRLIGTQSQNILIRSNSDSQKIKKREERYQIIYKLSTKPKSKKVVFTDDVVTTGATAMAAFNALGRPDGFEVWCIVCNPPNTSC